MSFVLSIIFLVGTVALYLTRKYGDVSKDGRATLLVGVWLCGLACLVCGTLATMVYVGDNEVGVVIKKLGSDLPPGQIIARNGEKGPQAIVLGPGWHLFYWPWEYDVNLTPIIEIKGGELGTVVASDGKPLPPGEIFAPEWKSANDMLDADKFLNGDGCKGPQLTVLTPGKYRMNPRLFTITQRPLLTVGVGEVVVVKANSGLTPGEKDIAQTVNGLPLVPKGYRGIWKDPLPPSQYYLHPDAFSTVHVRTVNRVYEYAEVQNKKSSDPIWVRSQDGFTFPVDIRIGVSVSAGDAPYMVAQLADPDAMVINSEGSDKEMISTLEARLILPTIKTCLRNVAEKMTALEFVDHRSEVEKAATAMMVVEMKQFKITTEGIFVGQIDFDLNEATKLLMKTRTDKELAVNQQKTYVEQDKAQQQRAMVAKSTEQAEQQKNLVAAQFAVQVQQQHALARKAEAEGEASYIEITATAKQKAYEQMGKAIGSEGVTTLEILGVIAKGQIPITPQVMVNGGNGGLLDALAGTILHRQMQEQKKVQAP